MELDLEIGPLDKYLPTVRVEKLYTVNRRIKISPESKLPFSYAIRNRKKKNTLDCENRAERGGFQMRKVVGQCLSHL